VQLLFVQGCETLKASEMAVYFDMPPANYNSGWPRDTNTYRNMWDDYVDEYADESQDNWFAWGTKQQSWEMNSKNHYSEYGMLGWPREIHQRSESQNWDSSSTAMFASLPAEPKEILVVNSTSSGSYASLCRDATTADVVAFDTEWVPDFEYGSDNPIAVLQLAFPTTRRVYVLQLGPLGKLPQEVQLMLVNPNVLKAGFAVNHKDAQKLSRTGIAVTQDSVVDVQERSAAVLGTPWEKTQSLSLKRAAQEVLGCELLKDKRCACSDWSRDKLTPEQVRYAALDALVALRLYYRLQ